MKNLIQKWNNISLIKRIICGLIIGIALGLIFPQATAISILGDLFVGALRGIAPLLVFFLIMSSLCRMAKGQKTNMSFIVILYLLGNLFSALSAVIASYLFPVTLTFSQSTNTQDITPPTGVTEVLKNLLMNVVANPVDSLVNANYIGILAWAIILGIALKSASDGTKNALENISDAIATAVKWIINCAPFGIMGLIFTTISEQGLDVLLGYGRLICVLVGTMLFVALIMNPLITFICLRKNPYPLVLRCLKDSGLTAFFTCCQHSGQHETLPGSWFGRGYLLHLHSTWRNYQYGRSCYYNLHHGTCRSTYTGYPRRLPDCTDSVRPLCSQRCRSFRCSRWITPSDSTCLQSLRYSERCCYASRWCRIHRWSYPGFLRNRTELIYRCPLYGNRRYAYTKITMRNTLREFLKLSRQSPRSRASTDFGSLLA